MKSKAKMPFKEDFAVKEKIKLVWNLTDLVKSQGLVITKVYDIG